MPAEHCSNGVEYKRLGEITNISRGKRLTRTELQKEGKYPVFHGSITPLGYYNEANREGDTVIVVNTGGIGGVKYCKDDFWCSDGCFSIDHCAHLNNKFLYYVLVGFQDYFISRTRVGGVPTIDQETVASVRIPLPPIEEQNRIVKILDQFEKLCNDLSEGLPAEIEARRKQYEYYRDKLLTFNVAMN